MALGPQRCFSLQVGFLWYVAKSAGVITGWHDFLPLVRWGILGRWLNLSEPLLPHLQSKDGQIRKASRVGGGGSWESAWAGALPVPFARWSTWSQLPDFFDPFRSVGVGGLFPVPARGASKEVHGKQLQISGDWSIFVNLTNERISARGTFKNMLT